MALERYRVSALLLVILVLVRDLSIRLSNYRPTCGTGHIDIDLSSILE